MSGFLPKVAYYPILFDEAGVLAKDLGHVIPWVRMDIRWYSELKVRSKKYPISVNRHVITYLAAMGLCMT
jgi:hypothetical protein